jgi:hypothetical protein
MEPSILQLGVEICMLPGRDVPLVFRCSNDHYQIVGNCFIYGMMQEGMMENGDDGEVKEQTLRFR